MKRCPDCRRDYFDDSLLFCLDDGSALLEGPASGGSETPASAGGQLDDGPVSCTSSFYFKDKNVNAADIGRELGVETILDGSVRRLGERLRITLQLVTAADGVQIWSEQYGRTMGDVFALQDELTRLVVETVTPILLNRKDTRI